MFLECLHELLLDQFSTSESEKMQRFEAPSSGTDGSSESPSTKCKRRRVGSSSSSTSSNSSYSSGSSSSESSREKVEAQPSGLLFTQLSLMDGGDSDESVYASQGKNPDRVKAALKEPCCKLNCKKRLRFNLVLKMVILFWSLPKASQDCLLWSMQQTTASDSESASDSEDDSDSDCSHSPRLQKRRVCWSLEGLHDHYYFRLRFFVGFKEKAI